MTIPVNSADAGRDTTLRDGAGDLRLNGDLALTNYQDMIQLSVTARLGWKCADPTVFELRGKV